MQTHSKSVFAVFLLNIWNFCSVEQYPKAHHMCKIGKSSLYSWTFHVINYIKIRYCRIMLDFPCHKVARSLLFNEAIWDKHWEEDVGLFGLALQSSNSNCLVQISHRQLGCYLLITRESLTDQHICKTLYKSTLNLYQQIDYWIMPMTAHWTKLWC